MKATLIKQIDSDYVDTTVKIQWWVQTIGASLKIIFLLLFCSILFVWCNRNTQPAVQIDQADTNPWTQSNTLENQNYVPETYVKNSFFDTLDPESKEYFTWTRGDYTILWTFYEPWMTDTSFLPLVESTWWQDVYRKKDGQNWSIIVAVGSQNLSGLLEMLLKENPNCIWWWMWWWFIPDQEYQELIDVYRNSYEASQKKWEMFVDNGLVDVFLCKNMGTIVEDNWRYVFVSLFWKPNDISQLQRIEKL